MKKNIIEIINTKKGNINYDFWRNIIMETKVEAEVDCVVDKVKKDVIKRLDLRFLSRKGISRKKRISR